MIDQTLGRRLRAALLHQLKIQKEKSTLSQESVKKASGLEIIFATSMLTLAFHVASSTPKNFKSPDVLA